MIQAIVEPEKRSDLGLHYTSLSNIMKVLHPLFLLSIEEEFEAARDSQAKLQKLLVRLTKIRVFDPACGSGNFLIIAYKELRKLEIRIFKRLKEIGQSSLAMTGIQLNQFFGIEYADFELVRTLLARDKAHIIAMTGSYFRGDTAPVLRPEDEEKFNRVSYTYYEQLNGYKNLKTLGIGYHFYRGRYADAIHEVLDPNLKTIIHIPSVRSAASTTKSIWERFALQQATKKASISKRFMTSIRSVP